MPGLMFDDRLTQTYRLESIDYQSYIKNEGSFNHTLFYVNLHLITPVCINCNLSVWQFELKISKFYIVQKMATSLIKNVLKNHPNKLINQFTSQY